MQTEQHSPSLKTPVLALKLHPGVVQTSVVSAVTIQTVGLWGVAIMGCNGGAGIRCHSKSGGLTLSRLR